MPTKPRSRALVIAGAGMRRKHSYDTGVGLLEDIEEVASVLETEPSVRNQAFPAEAQDEEQNEEQYENKDDYHQDEDVYHADQDLPEDETLVEVDGELYKEKEVEIEVSDSESDSNPNSDAESVGDRPCGVRRKRTIRVVIRSRAFI